MKFITKNLSHPTLHFGCNHLNWKNDTEHMIPKLVEYVMLLGQWPISVTFSLSNQFIMHTSILL
jgi:hypothetical protein